MPWGRFKGTPPSKVSDKSYLFWFFQQCHDDVIRDQNTPRCAATERARSACQICESTQNDQPVLDSARTNEYNSTMTKKSQKLSGQLRRAIEQSEMTRYEISKQTGIYQSVLSRFMHEQVGLSLESVDLICECLGLRLVAEEKPKKRKGR